MIDSRPFSLVSVGFIHIPLVIDHVIGIGGVLIQRQQLFLGNLRHLNTAHIHLAGDHIGNQPGAIFAHQLDLTLGP